MTAEEFLKLLPNLKDGVLQQDYVKKSELHDTIISAMKLLEDKTQATRLIDLTFQVNPKLAAKLAGAATSSVEEVVSQRFKALVENNTWREYYGLYLYLKINLLSETLAIWVIPDLERVLQLPYSPYEVVEALTRIATQAESNTTKDAAIAALMRGLENKNKQVRASAIEQLGYMGCNVATESLLTILKSDPDWKRRCDAAEALGKIKDLRAVDGLMAALEDPQGHVCNYSIKALGNLKSTKPVELLIRKLQDTDPKIRSGSANALGRIGSDLAINPLISTLKDTDPIVRWHSAEALGNIGNEKANTPLIDALQDKHIIVILKAIIALGQIGNDVAIAPLTEISTSDSLLQKAIILALDKITIKNEKQFPIKPLLSALSDRKSEVKQLAAQKLLSKTNYLGQYPQSLLNGLKDSCMTIRMESARLLGQINTKDLDVLGINSVVDALIDNLVNDNSARVKRVTINTLGQFQNQKAIAPLISISQNLTEYRRVRRDAMCALEKIGTDRMFQLLISALKDPVSSVRSEAAKILSRIADDSAIEYFVASLSDKYWEVRHYSCDALIKRNHVKVESELLKTLDNSETIIRHRHTIFSLLPKVGSKKSFDKLISLLADPNKSIKAEAASTIAKFACEQKNFDRINNAVEPLINISNHSKAFVRNAAINTLHQIAIHPQCLESDRAAIASVLEIAENDRNDYVRKRAKSALKDIFRQNAFDYLIQELDSSDTWVVVQAIERLGKMIHSQTVTKLEKLTLTDTQIKLAIAKIQQLSTNSNRCISKLAKEILSHL